MLKNKLKQFCKSTSGATAVEFAIISIVFLTSVFGIFEFSRVMWTQQVLQDVAQKSARCSAIGNAEGGIQCMSEAQVRNFTVSQASGFGIRVPDSAVEINLGVMCNGYNANMISINLPTSSPVIGLIPQIQDNISAVSCFPV